MFKQGVSSTDDSAIDLLLGVKTPGADDLLGAVKKDQDPAKVDNPEPDPANPVIIEGEQKILPEDEIDNILGGIPDPANPAKEKRPDPVKAAVAPTAGDPKKEAKPAAPKLDEAHEINYEAIYHDMVEQGVWQEVEIPEGKEWSKELFVEIQKLQSASQYEDLLDRTGPIGKRIIEFEQNGGNPSELLNLFREQREIQTFDIKEPEGQEEFLRAYLESQGNSQKSIDRTIQALIDQGGLALKEEAEEKKEIWDREYKDAIAAAEKEQALENKRLEDAQINFHKTITQAIQSDTEVTPKERRELQAYMLNYVHNFQGKEVSQFYMDMAEIQKDPKNYLELAKFVKGVKTGEYAKKVADKAKKETSATSYLKIKNGAAVGAPGVGNPDLETNRGSSFLQLLKK